MSTVSGSYESCGSGSGSGRPWRPCLFGSCLGVSSSGAAEEGGNAVLSSGRPITGRRGPPGLGMFRARRSNSPALCPKAEAGFGEGLALPPGTAGTRSGHAPGAAGPSAGGGSGSPSPRAFRRESSVLLKPGPWWVWLDGFRVGTKTGSHPAPSPPGTVFDNDGVWVSKDRFESGVVLCDLPYS